MHSITGEIYRDFDKINELKSRGEPLIELTEKEADMLSLLNRHQRRKALALIRRGWSESAALLEATSG